MVREWNSAVIKRIEDTYGGMCEAVDIIGMDPSGASSNLTPDKRTLAGIQTLDTLRLRTCMQHRMRLMLTHNSDTKNR